MTILNCRTVKHSKGEWSHEPEINNNIEVLISKARKGETIDWPAKRNGKKVSIKGELTSGRSYWNKISIHYNDGNAFIELLSNSKNPDGPRACGVAFAALLKTIEQYKLNSIKNVYIHSTAGFGEKAIPLCLCLSKAKFRKMFWKSFVNNKDSINKLTFSIQKNISSKAFEAAGRSKLTALFNKGNFDPKVKSPDNSENPIQISGIPIRKNLKADAWISNGKKVFIGEVKKHKVDFADGVCQLIQNWMLIREINSGADISCYLVVNDTKESPGFENAKEFFKNNKSDFNLYINVNDKAFTSVFGQK